MIETLSQGIITVAEGFLIRMLTSEQWIMIARYFSIV